jgi:TPR repeat protein
MYARGRGVAQDEQQAVTWYHKAAEQGDADAQYNLGIRYADGKGVTQDYIEAHMWFSLASAGGEERAIKNRAIVEEKMTREQIAEARLRASAWTKTEPK